MAPNKKEKSMKQNPKDKVLQDITNLCVTIGDKSFLIRQTKGEIQGLYAQIDKLRADLRTLAEVKSDGSEGAK